MEAHLSKSSRPLRDMELHDPSRQVYNELNDSILCIFDSLSLIFVKSPIKPIIVIKPGAQIPHLSSIVDSVNVVS